jgi:hypothetical protein
MTKARSPYHCHSQESACEESNLSLRVAGRLKPTEGSRRKRLAFTWQTVHRTARQPRSLWEDAGRVLKLMSHTVLSHVISSFQTKRGLDSLQQVLVSNLERWRGIHVSKLYTLSIELSNSSITVAIKMSKQSHDDALETSDHSQVSASKALTLPQLRTSSSRRSPNQPQTSRQLHTPPHSQTYAPVCRPTRDASETQLVT